MICMKIRKSSDRGAFKFSWLDTKHTFSFGDYQDANHMGFRHLRVLNEDLIAPHTGFSTHGHRDMEIISYIAAGALSHQDSLGNGSVIKPGELQRMSAGTGIRHSEKNETDQTTHLLQIWIVPNKMSLAPDYQQLDFSEQMSSGRLTLLACGQRRERTLFLNQDVDIWAIKSERELEEEFLLRQGRGFWMQLIRGNVSVSFAGAGKAAVEQVLAAGDGLSSEVHGSYRFRASKGTEFLLFDCGS